MTSTRCDLQPRTNALAACLGVLAFTPVVSAGQEAPPSPAPLVVVERIEPERYDNTLAPQILVLPDGSYVAKFEHSGHYSSNLGVYIARSTDRGASWKHAAKLEGVRYTSLFAAGGKLYLIGTEGSGRSGPGFVVVQSSSDGGTTWTGWKDETSGLLRGDSHLERSAAPVVVHAGRVWSAFHRTVIRDGTRGVRGLVASAALDADLLRADAWRWSDEVFLPDRWAACSALLERDEPPLFVLTNPPNTPIAIGELSADGWELHARASAKVAGTFDTDPAGWAPRWDLVAKRYVMLSTAPDESGKARASLALATSPDLVTWDQRGVLLRSEERLGWADWTIDGDDLLVVVCTSVAKEVAKDEKPSWERALLFFRVPRFRERTPDTPPIPASMKPK